MTEEELNQTKLKVGGVVVAQGPNEQIRVGILVTDVWSYGFTLRIFDNGQLVLCLVPNTFVLVEVPDRVGVGGLVRHMVSAVHLRYDDDERIVAEVTQPEELEAIAEACVHEQTAGKYVLDYPNTFNAAIKRLPSDYSFFSARLRDIIDKRYTYS